MIKKIVKSIGLISLYSLCLQESVQGIFLAFILLSIFLLKNRKNLTHNSNPTVIIESIALLVIMYCKLLCILPETGMIVSVIEKFSDNVGLVINLISLCAVIVSYYGINCVFSIIEKYNYSIFLDFNTKSIFFFYHIFFLIFKSVLPYFFRIVDELSLSILFPLSIALFFKESCKKKDSKVSLFISLLIIFYFLSNVVNGILFSDPSIIYSNELLNTVFIVLTCYSIGLHIFESNNQKKLLKITHIYMNIWAIFLSVILVLIVIFKRIVLPWGPILHNFGNLELGCYYNILALRESVYIMLSIILLINCKKKISVINSVYLIIINYVALSLTNSRTSLVGFLVSISLFVSWIIFNKKRNILLSVITFIISFLILYFLRNCIIDLFVNMASIRGGSRELLDESTMKLTGRTDIWKYSLIGLFKNPVVFLFGISRSKIAFYINNVSYGLLDDSYTHNQFIEVLCCSGIFTLITYVLLLLETLKNIYKGLKIKISINKMIVACFIAMMLIINLAEARLIYDMEIMNLCFFVIMGVISSSKWNNL